MQIPKKMLTALQKRYCIMKLDEWAAKKKRLQGGELVIKIRKNRRPLSLPRGNMVRAFVYVKKSDITASSHAEVIQKTPVTSATSSPQSTVTPIYPQAVQTIASCTEYKQLEPTLEAEKRAGRVRHYALYGKLSNPDSYYLVIFNTVRKIVAVLSKGQSRLNVKTGQPDGVANYSGCAVGFSVNE